MLVLVILCQFLNTVPAFSRSVVGDLNGDNSVDSIDFAILKKYLLYNNSPSETDWIECADVYKDGTINSLDLAVFRKYMLGMIDGLPFTVEQSGNTSSPTNAVQVTPTPQGDWIPFIPQPECFHEACVR